MIDHGRATVATWQDSNGGQRAIVAAERVDLISSVLPEVSFSPAIALPLGFAETWRRRKRPIKKIVQGWLEVSGPVSAAALAARIGLPVNKVDAALLALESAGVVMRGEFTGRCVAPRCKDAKMPKPSSGAIAYCSRASID